MTGEGGILTIAGLTSLLGFLKGSLIGLFPKEMDRPLAWAFRCPLINWFVLAIKSFFCSRRSDLREASIAGGQRVEVFKGSRCSRWSCVLTLWCHYTKIFVVCHTRFILLHGQNHGQATHDDDGGGCSVHGTREAVPCAVRVLQVAAVTSMAHPKFLELENSRFSADFSFRKKEDFWKISVSTKNLRSQILL